MTDASGDGTGFNNGNSGEGDDYSYDGAGNATRDANRGIGTDGIKYNHLNLVRQVGVNGKTMRYNYDGAGSKLKMENGLDNTKYAGAFEYNNANLLTRIATEEGQINVTNGGNDFSVEYYLKDHLGNTRMVLNEAGTMVQETEYFPFGLAIPRTAGSNKYKFLGKETQPETNWIDLQARFFDPTIGRFMTVDPVTKNQEQLSVYQYGWDNPIRYSDPDGKFPKCPICDDLKNLVVQTKNYVKENVSAYRKHSIEVTAGLTGSVQVEGALGVGLNVASARIYKKEKTQNYGENSKTEVDNILKKDQNGRHVATISHGAEFSEGYGAGGKTEYKLNSWGKSAGDQTVEGQVSAMGVFLKYENNQNTGENSLTLGASLNPKAGLGIVVDLNIIEVGLKFKLPNTK